MTNSTASGRGTRSTWTARVVAALAVAGLALTAGTGFMLSATDAAARSEAETAALRVAAANDRTQLAVGSDILHARATGAADAAIAQATAVVAAAAGKADAAPLAATLDQLGAADLISPARVYELVAAAQAQSADVSAAVAEFDRVEAERRAAEEAARKAAEEAAARAAAEAGAGGASGGSTPRPPANPSEAQQIAREMGAARYGWGDDQFGCLVAVWDYESHWNVYAQNANGAYGIPQALPGSKMASHGADWQTNPATQISWGIDYIHGRYGDPCGAWAHIESAGWY
ncbi:lytic transglycosylase domain-containing protein [Agromyces sp. MMS24-JH15]|uniref:aggregation-promoting factor C-terminal-like domain-containing protein n=1 Tax=Agromyces sp. MMS24-JH15 TaxID=3243765 RepID=UPI00374A66EE